MKMSFNEWLKTVDPIGFNERDFKSDALSSGDMINRDGTIAKPFETLSDLEWYLRSHNACDGAFDAARSLWARFQEVSD